QLLPDCSLMRVMAFAHDDPPPHGKGTASEPRAAYSHSRSVGRRLPTKRQYPSASAQCTHDTGRSGSGPSKVQDALARAGCAQAPAFTQARYASTVTSVR